MVKLPKLHLDREPIFNSATEGIFYSCEYTEVELSEKIRNDEAVPCSYCRNIEMGDMEAYEELLRSCFTPLLIVLLSDGNAWLLNQVASPPSTYLN